MTKSVENAGVKMDNFSVTLDAIITEDMPVA